jgi:hypothetical protein
VHAEKEIRGAIIFKIALREKKKKRIILTKEAKDFYNKNYKTLKTLEDRRTSHVHGLTELIL